MLLLHLMYSSITAQSRRIKRWCCIFHRLCLFLSFSTRKKKREEKRRSEHRVTAKCTEGFAKKAQRGGRQLSTVNSRPKNQLRK